MAKTQQTTDVVALNFRIPRALHRRLTRLAVREGRSLNAQMIWMLEQATDQDQKARQR